MAVKPQRHVNNHIGKGSSIPEMRKLNPENRRAKKLHTPSAVAENRTGKKYWFAAKLILKQHVTPNLAIKKITKNQGDDWFSKPHASIRIPPTVEIISERIKLRFTPILW